MEPSALADVLAPFADVLDLDATRPDARHPIVRSGPRDPVDPLLRLLVWWRDEGRCQMCGRDGHGRQMELDHVVPWSAGGPDVGTNLRVVCPPCNAARSNFIEITGTRRYRAVTPCCDRCVEQHDEVTRYRKGDKRHGLIIARLTAPCTACTGYAELSPGDPDATSAFCGQCLSTSYVSDPRRVL